MTFSPYSLCSAVRPRTILAAERVGRRAYTLEIEPRFADDAAVIADFQRRHASPTEAQGIETEADSALAFPDMASFVILRIMASNLVTLRDRFPSRTVIFSFSTSSITARLLRCPFRRPPSFG